MLLKESFRSDHWLVRYDSLKLPKIAKMREVGPFLKSTHKYKNECHKHWAMLYMMERQAQYNSNKQYLLTIFYV